MDIKYQYRANIPTAKIIQQFKNLLFPDLSKKRADRLPSNCDIVLALEGQKLIGLLVASKSSTQKKGEILSLAVVSPFRNKGIGKNLLKAFEKGMTKQAIERLSIHFRSHWPTAEIIDKLLRSSNWLTPKVDFVIVDGKAEKVLQLFDENQIQYPSNYHTKPWSELSESLLQEIKTMSKQKGVASDQNPFIAEDSINQTCSLVLFHNDTIIGWVMSHVISENSNEFTSYYIAPEHRSYNLAYKFMRETIFRQHELTQQSNFIIVAKASNQVMSKFLLRHAQKTEVKLVKTMLSEKLLDKDSND